MKSHIPNLSSRGSSLIQVLMAVGISAVVLVGVATAIDTLTKQNKVAQIQASRDLLVRTVTMTLASKAMLDRSVLLPENADWLVCAAGGDAAGSPGKLCRSKNATGPLIEYPAALVSLDGNEYISAGNAKGRPYDSGATACGSKTLTDFDQDFSECALRVRTTFHAICAGDTEECDVADAIEFTYTVMLNPAFPVTVPLKPATGIVPIVDTGSATVEAGGANGVGNLSCDASSCCVNFGQIVRCFNRSSGNPVGADIPLNLGKWIAVSGSGSGLPDCYSTWGYTDPTGKGCSNLGAKCAGRRGTAPGGGGRGGLPAYQCSL